ncbi:hypothetical protein [Jeotgalicoccus sp. ATCC 8456]|uniref:hypothetical protein n=1 Tax=Jeotgalicoccus sp. ATCC 8456 TaxID=946435 RepID=UPI0018E646CC|nr:hypothetical protein [Jeotgalicoccus sp. ATCC 8456]QQD84730.1 hypothetical protein JEM45_08935 [Jeotgalicoccus sp. ATCC 8456]
MIKLKNKTRFKYLLWIFLYALLVTIIVGAIIHFTDESAGIHYQAMYTQLSVVMILFGLLAYIVLKKMVGYGVSRQTFFKESTGTVLFLSIYSAILINIFYWLLIMTLNLDGQINASSQILELIVINISGILSGVIYYYVGLIIYYSFKKNIWLGTLVTLILGGITVYFNFSEIVSIQPIIMLVISIVSVVLLGYFARKLVLNATINIY